MAMPAKSAQEHRLNGTKSHAKNQDSPFTGGRPRVPKHLCPAAKKAFKRACQLLENRRTLTPSDETTLELYAETYALWLQAKTEVGDKLMIAITVLDNNGIARTVTRINPLLKVVETSSVRLLALAKSLGLTQVDIGRTKQTGVDSRNEIVAGSIEDIEQQGGNVLPFVPLVPTGDEDAE
jgi:P27 family predicted phage terminase small subunit